MKRVVITGLGVIAANGIGVDQFWTNNINGISGIGPITRFDPIEFRTKIAAEVKDYCPQELLGEYQSNKIDRFSQFALSSARMAIDDAQLNTKQIDPYRMGVALGSGLGGMFFYEKQMLDMQKHGHKKTHPASIVRVMPNAPCGHVSIEFNCRGPNLTVSTACASANHAIGQAYELIKLQKADCILAGGTEAPLVYYNFAGFDALNVMSTNNANYESACCPFDLNRDGLVMGEGAGILLLEEYQHAIRRNAHIYAEIVGYALTSGAHHIVMPLENGEDAAKTMTLALAEAKLKPSDIDYINAHGTSTQINDKSETCAIKEVFGEYAGKIPISSTKSMTGHTFGAAGALEAIVGCLSIKNNIVPPTINYRTSDPECDLDYVPNQARHKQVKTVLSNSFAFGSNNTTLILKECTS